MWLPFALWLGLFAASAAFYGEPGATFRGDSAEYDRAYEVQGP